MKKKGTIGIVATLGIGLCAYALSQQPQVKEEKKNQIQYLQADKKSSATASSKKEDSIEAVNAKEKTQAEQIVIKITDEGFAGSNLSAARSGYREQGQGWLYYQTRWEILSLLKGCPTYSQCALDRRDRPKTKRRR